MVKIERSFPAPKSLAEEAQKTNKRIAGSQCGASASAQKREIP